MGEVYTRCNSLEALPPFSVEVWCPDCTGIDPLGCFDGGCEKSGPYESYAKAVDAAHSLTDDSIWRFSIYDARGYDVLDG
jgi:hypothetical protein